MIKVICMKTVLLAILIIFSNIVLAYTPTLDSLLRNGNNTEIGNNTIIVNLKVTKKSTLDILESDSASEVSKLLAPKSFRLQVFNEREDFPKLVQLQYNEGSFNKKKLYDLKVTPFHTLNSISKNNEKIEQRFFMAIMSMLLTNSSKLMMEFLQENGIDVKSNKDLINQEKHQLLENYKNYLLALKSDSEEKEELKNPLKSEDPETSKEIKKIMAQTYLNSDGLVQRSKVGDFFNWVVQTDRLYINFDDSHRITEVSLKLGQGELKATFGRFIILGNNIEFPETIEITDLAGNTYELKGFKAMVISDSSKKFFKRLEMYKKQIEENAIEQIAEPSIFLL